MFLGFISLLLVPSTPMRHLGIAGAIGAAMAFLSAYSVYPWFLEPATISRPGHRSAGALTSNVRSFFSRRHGWVVTALAVFTVLGACGLPRLNTDPELPSYFKKGGDIRSGLDYVDTSGGSSPLKLVVEDKDRAPLNHKEAYERLWALQRSLENQGIKFRFNTTAESAKIENGKVKVAWKSRDGGESGTEEVEKLLVAVGRRPVTDNLGLDRVGIALDKKGFIPVDENYQTKVPGIYAIGDVIGGLMLAHKAEEEGVVAAESIAGQNVHMHYKSIPNVVYTWPEIAAVGLTEREVKQDGREYRVGRFPFSANGRARTMGETAGFVKFIADARTDELLGAHLVGPNVSELVSEVVLGFEYRASADDLGMTVHAHPTLAESTKEAALATLGRALHI